MFYSSARIFLSIFILLIFSLSGFAQSVGDYRSNGDGNWSTLATWQRWSGAAWVVPTAGQGYPGQNASPALVTIRNGDIIDLDVSPANSIGSLDIPTGNNDSWINFTGTNSLTVTGATTIAANSNNDYKAILVNAGSFTSGSLSLSGGGDTQDAYLELTTGSATITGNVTMVSTDPDRNYILFSGAGTLYVGGTMSGGTITSTANGGTNAPTSGTVNYNNAGAQNVGSYTYYNLTISGGSTKTIQGNVTVNNTLNLSNGNLSLGSAAYNLTIANGASITTPGSFDNTHMITTDGTGYLYKYSNTPAPFVMTYPIGRGTNYTPMQITSFSATVTAGSYIRVRVDPTAATGPPAAGASDLQRFWSVTTSGLTGITANATFSYIDPTDIGAGGDELTYNSAYNTGSAWTTPAGASVNTSSNTFSTTGTTSLTGQWTAREPAKTYYSYQSGDWSLASTWTLDPSGTIYTNPSSSIPGSADRAVILNGRTITTAVARSVLSLQINEGGVLNIGTSAGHNFGTVTGQGRLVMASTSFPGGTFTDFVSAGGGTVEMTNTAGFNFSTLTQYTFNNLIINFNGASTITAIYDLASTMQINGNFTVQNGTFQINNTATTQRNINIVGDLIVESTGNITLGTGNNTWANAHTITIGGDLTNNGGSVKFTNRTLPFNTAYYTSNATNGCSNVIFNNATKDQYVTCNGATWFHRIEINKGTDWTYVLNIDADNANNFWLFGRNDYHNGFTPPGASPNIVNDNALGLENGTCRLGTNIVIPCLSSSFYFVDEDAMLWIDGAQVVYKDATYGGTNVGFYDYGGLKVTAGGTYTMNAFSTRGIVMRGAAFVEVDDATLTAQNLRTSANGAVNRGTFIMRNNASVTFTGNTTSGDFATFSLGFADNVVDISGGTLNITSPTTAGGNANLFSIQVASNTGNISVTGGTINITIPNGSNAYIASRMPFWNLNLLGTNTARNLSIRKYNAPGAALDDPITITPLPLIVKNDLSLNAQAVLNTNNTNDADTTYVNVQVAGDFTLPTGSIYTPGANNTIFNGTGAQTFDASGTITGNLRDLTLTNTSDLTLNGNNLTVLGTFTLGDGCTLRDNGRIIYAQGNIVNSGTHFKPVSGAGSIQLTGTAAQVISGDGTGIFNNLTLNKTGGSTTMSSNFSITGELRLANTTAVLNLGSNLLTFGTDGIVYDAVTGSGQSFNASRMIQTNGLLSDGGVSKAYNSTSAFLFPFGFGAYYMPASIQFSSPVTPYGTVNTKPVNARHPLAQGSNNVLTCYWSTTSTGFGSIPAGTVRHLYYYNDAFVPVPANEVLYVPGYFDNISSWIYINDVNLVNQGTNEISYNIANSADGDFTAGETSAFVGIPVLYSSGFNTDWDNPLTWSATGVGDAGGAGVPGANTLVVIGDDTHNHTVIINANGRQCGSLYIAEGSTLDLQTYTGHNFAALPSTGVTGRGTLRIASSNYFPQGDFGDFIGPDGGTVEYYTSAAVGNITIPTASSVTLLALNTYHHLKLTHSSTYTITLPDRDLTVYGDLTISGSGSGSAGTRNAGTSRTYTINGNLLINSGVFEFRNGVISAIKVLGDANIAAGASFRAATTGTVVNNVLEFYGSLNCAATGTFDMNNTGRAYTYFKGATNETLSGSGTIDFYNLFVDKGSDATSILDVTANPITTGFTNPFLTLSNGTFRVNNSLLNLTLSTTSAFNVPSTACLSVEAGTVTVGTADNNGDLILSGKLEVIGGTMNIGNGGAFNNDIQYASAGSPEINISGGQLNVNGQIRRSTTITSGALNYFQSGGDVIIYGRNQQVTRARLEITNSGSSFISTGGTITIWSAGGTSFGDVYLRPETYSVTGGTLNIGNGTSTAGQTFDISTSSPLWNVNIGTDAVSQTYNLNILPLTVLNDLTINGNSEFHANGYDVNIGHNFTNENSNAGTGIATGGYQPGSLTQITILDGATDQAISGSGANLTNFANLIINSTGTDSLLANTNLRINSDLTLNSGRLADGGNTITVLGDIENNAIHSSYAGNGIVLAGTQKQVISGSGTGVFGNVELNNTNGVDMVDNTTIKNTLTFTNGFLYIDDYLLTMGTNASIGGTPGTNKMIILNGVLSDLGVKKLFPSGASAAFTYPIGVSGKYTPVTYTITANGAPGSITVRPVNSYHPAETDATGNELDYYWSVVSTGFSSPTISHRYQYSSADVSGTEANYVIGQYNYLTYIWNDLGDNIVDETNHRIDLTNAGFIDGEYTAGASSNFMTLIPLYSRNSRPTNNWTGPQSWTTNADGSDCSDANCTGGHATLAPAGNPVTVLSGHTILLDTDGAVATSVVINGTLDADATTFHNLGHVSGTGRLVMTSTTDGMFVFPGGVFDDFMNTSSTIIEFTGTNTATLPLKPGNLYKPYQNVVLSGTGQKNMSAEHMKILGDLTISPGTVLSNSLYNKELHILGDWIDNNTSATGGFVPGTGRVYFEGTSPQVLTVTNGATTEQFYNLSVNNPSGVTLSGGGQVLVTRYLYLTSGNITTSTTNLLSLSYTSTGAIVGGGSSSFIDGPLRKNIISSQSFTFPVGDGARYGQFVLLNTSVASSPQYWTVSYFNTNPDPEDDDVLNSPISSISDNEYWVVNRPSGGTANIRLRWDAGSYPGVTSDPVLRSRLRVVEYDNATGWTERGQTVSGNATSGTVSTSTPVSDDDYIFTLGVSGVTAAITTPPLSYTICDNGEIASIPVTLTGNQPWTLSYRTTGAGPTIQDFTQTGITSSPYTIQLTGADMGGSANSPYTLSLVSISDNATSGVCNPTTVEINVSQTYIPNITGTFTVGSGETRTYSTTNNAGSSYLWSWVGASGGTIASPNSATTDITFNAGTGTFQLQIEETSSTGCVATDVQSIVVSNVPTPDITPKTANICINSTITYSTTYNAGNEYLWTVTNGTCASCGTYSTNASVDVTWNTSGNSSVSVRERIIATPAIYGDATENYYVSPMPVTQTLSADPICNGDPAFVETGNSETGVSYQLRLNSDDSYVGSAVAGSSGNPVSMAAGTPAITTAYNVLAYNEGCQLRIPATPGSVTVVVDDPPTASAGSDESICAGSTFDLSTSTTPPSASDYSSLSWATSGDGNFNDNTLLQPIYTPGANDISAGSVTLTLTANGNGACTAVNDDMSLIITPVPAINNPGNQTVCDSYTLPAITGTNLTGNEAYYTGSGGTGTQYNATDVITSSTTLYIYDETGTTPNCYDEESFTITVNVTPTVNDIADQVVCDSYTLPAITGTNLTGNEAY